MTQSHAANLGVCDDMTKSVRISREGRIDLSSDDERYRSLLTSIYDGVLITDRDGMIEDANPRSSEFLLFEVSELIGMNVLDMISGADEKMFARVLIYLEEHRFALLSAECVRNDGSKFSAEIAVSRMASSPEERLCFFVRDITVRKQAEKVMAEALDRLKKQDKARQQLVSNVSHELRTPLTSITYGIANMLKGGAGEFSDKAHEYLERFDRECKRLLATVDDVLDLTKIEGSTFKMMKVRVPLTRLVARSVGSLELHAEHKGVTLSVDAAMFPAERPDGVPARSGFVMCDVVQLERAVLNIVGNAVKYTPAGGCIQVGVAGDPQQYGKLLVSVEDTGHGIPAEALASVTDRFYRVGERADGSGLGLAITREIVDRHGGVMTIQSPPPGKEQGTLVTIALDAVDAPRVLVVDDSKEARGVVETYLGFHGYDVVSEGYAGGALALVREGGIDLVIVDIMLPGMDGVQMIVAMRGSENTEEVPVVVITGADVDAAKQEILRSFSIPILMKPLKQDHLLDAVESALASRRTLDK